MPTNFPTTLDSLTNPATGDLLSSGHASQHANINDAVEALEAKVGVNSSAVTSSLDYKLTNASSADPGHTHTISSLTGVQASDSDLTALAGLSSTGMIARTGSGTASVRTITGSTGLSVSNGDGVSGNPTLSLSGGKQTVWVPAAAMRPSSTGGCAALALVATSSNQPDLSTLDFDASSEEYAQFWVAMPKSWNESTVTAQFLWSHASTSTNFAVIWGIQGLAISDDDTIGAAYGTAQTVTDTGGTTNDLYISAETSAITIGGTPAEGDMVAFRVYRKSADGSDTLAIDARLHGVKLLFTTNAGTDD